MVDDEDCRILAIHMALEHPCNLHPLFHVQVGTRFIEDIEISIF